MATTQEIRDGFDRIRAEWVSRHSPHSLNDSIQSWRIGEFTITADGRVDGDGFILLACPGLLGRLRYPDALRLLLSHASDATPNPAESDLILTPPSPDAVIRPYVFPGESYYCDGCHEDIDPLENPCSICKQCASCCPCWYCETCREMHTENVAQCNVGDHCTDNHDCVWCESHSRFHDEDTSMCDSCHACDDRCECSYCEGCGIRGDFSTCHDCSRCDECCDCGSRGDYPLEFNTHSLRFIHADTFLVNPLTRPISLEIETQGANAPTYALERAIDHWDTSVVADGSLGDSGWELNTQPANGDAFVSLIQDHAKGLDAAECVVDESCGVHVHVDARDITEKELRKIIVLYQRVEPMLYALSGNRVSNRYCAPCGNYYGYWPHDPFEARMRLRSILYRDGKRLKKSQYYRDSSTKRTYLPEMGEKYHHSRYHALNIHSYYKRRTIEFRHHKGTVDGTRLQNWGLVCGHLIEFAKTHFYEEIMDIEGDALAVLLAITPASLHEWVTSRAKWLRNDFPVYNHAAAKAKAMAQKAEEQSEVIYKRQREAMLAETRRAESQSIYNNEAWGSN